MTPSIREESQCLVASVDFRGNLLRFSALLYGKAGGFEWGPGQEKSL